ncbi:MAG: hypothetical protein QOE90_2737 [Thermoplasmata archaeon]|nr:hypothetical protein [Thermoplasmata archaeon]
MDPLPSDVRAAQDALNEARGWTDRERARRAGAYQAALGVSLCALALAVAPFAYEPLWAGRGRGTLRLWGMVGMIALTLLVAFGLRRLAFRRLQVQPDALWGVAAPWRWVALLATALAVVLATFAFDRPDLNVGLAVMGGAAFVAFQAARGKDATHAALAALLAAFGLVLLTPATGDARIEIGLAAVGAAFALVGWRRARSAA